MKNLISLLIFLVAMGAATHAQPVGTKSMYNTFPDPETGDGIEYFKRSYALIIANENYKYSKVWGTLEYPHDDAEKVKKVLEASPHYFNGVFVHHDLNSKQMENVIEDFIKHYGMERDNRLVIFYSGHGDKEEVYDGSTEEGFMIPVDCPSFQDDPTGYLNNAIRTKDWNSWALEMNCRHALFVFDCCFGGKIFDDSQKRNATQMDSPLPVNIQVAALNHVRFFMSAGHQNEPVPDRSLFCDYFLRAISGDDPVADEDPGNKGYLTGYELGAYVQAKVYGVSNGNFKPLYGKIKHNVLDKGNFVFVMPWVGKASSSNYPPTDTKPDITLYPLLPEMIFVEGDSKDPHGVHISDFYLGKYEVTVAQFEKFINETNYETDADRGGGSFIWNSKLNDYEKKDGVNWKCNAIGNIRQKSEYHHPVIHVSWNDAKAYCDWLSKKTEKTYILPSEAQWEYAAGNGSKRSKYSWGNDNPKGKQGGNVADESLKVVYGAGVFFDDDYNDHHIYSAPVGEFNPNQLGFYDMTGNVSEWCEDLYDTAYYENRKQIIDSCNTTKGSKRVLKGGNWTDPPTNCMVSHREKSAPVFRFSTAGFRVVKVP